jgi:hypothetical protein
MKKETMIFEERHLDIIKGLARLKEMQIKDVLNQLLQHSINALDEETREEAEKLGKYLKTAKKKIYFK